MIRKFCRLLLITALSLTYLIISINMVLSAQEDFTTWTTVDPFGRMTVTADNVTWVGMSRAENAWVQKDLGTDNFSGDFAVNFEFAINAHDANALVYPVVIANVNDDWRGLFTANEDAIGVHYKDNNFGNNEIGVDEIDGGTTYGYVIDNLLTDNITYYFTLMRNEAIGAFGTIYLYIYSDSDRETLIGTCTITLHSSKKDYTKIQVATSIDEAGGQLSAGVISNLDYSPILQPDVTTLPADNITYDDFLQEYSARLNATVVDDGNEEVSGAFFYRDLTDNGSLLWANTIGTFGDGDNFSAMVYPLEANHEYEFYAYVFNTLFTDTGDNLTFTVELGADIPTMQTLGYPFEASSENLSVNLYGTVIWDGTSNVTAWMQYRTSGSENWTDSSSNVTELQTTDTYSINITGLSLFVGYDYRAVGSNDNGTGYADGYGTFTLGYEVTTPVVVTGNVTELTDTSVRLYGMVTDNGSGSTFAYFQYRVTGNDDWFTTAGYYVQVGDNFTRTVTVLSSDTDYGWRAVVWNYDENYNRNYAYGDIKQFHTYTSITIPIMSTSDNITYISGGTISVTGSVLFDGGSPVSVWFQSREYGTSVWIDTDYVIPNVTTGYQVSWYISGLEITKSYDVRVIGSNFAGTGYGNIVSFQISSGGDGEDIIIPIGTDGGDGDAISDPFVIFINTIRASLGLYGLMGTWAFLGLILLCISLLFGIGMVSVKDIVIQRMIGVVWALISIAVTGAFIFTGQLGIWPIIILVSATVLILFITAGFVLSGGRSNG